MLGKGKRVVIPACVVYKIRKTDPEVNGVYVGFKPSDELYRNICTHSKQIHAQR